MSKVKTASYTVEQEKAILESVNIASLSYESQTEILEELSETELFTGETKGQTKKTGRQLAGKLSFMSRAGKTKQVDGSPCYVHKIYAPSTGGSVLRKKTLVDSIVEAINNSLPDDIPQVNPEVLESLEKATKPALLVVLGALLPNDES